MLTLYILHGCPFCEYVLETMHELDLHPQLKDIEEEGVSEELIATGGKRQVPYLIDDEHGVQMYESEDIVRYLKKTYARAISN